jgi:hypothetical protein
MPDWSIKIQGKPAVFTPDIDRTKPGTPLKVVTGDLVSWNNTTGEEHWPWPVASANAPPLDPPPGGNVLVSAVIKPDSSSPAYNIVSPAGTTIFYCCKCHPNERGQMVVVAFGQ